MSISIQPAVIEDADEMLDVGIAAFAGDLMNMAIFNLDNATPEELAEHSQWRTSMTRLRISGQGKHWFKAIDEASGKIVGFTGLYSPDADTSNLASLPKPKCINVEVYNEIISTLEAAKKELMGNRQDYWCKNLLPFMNACFKS